MDLHSLNLPDWTTQVLIYIGLVTLLYATVQLTRQASIYLHRGTLQKRYNHPNQSNWALVTGATDGIGFGFCQELCARGFNVILHGRNAAKLQRRQAELAHEFPAQKTGILCMDVTEMDETIDLLAEKVHKITHIAAEPAGRLTVLVNNVGGDSNAYRGLGMLGYPETEANIARNASFMVHATRVLLPLLVQNAPGLVLNISSFASYGMPYISVYSGTKGFVDSFTRALEAEMKAEGSGVEVLGLRVGQVRSAGLDYVKSGLFVPESRTMAAAGLDRVGCGRPVVTGYFWHWLQGLSLGIMPRWLMMKIIIRNIQELRALEEEKNKKA
jgi:short-subunit dehydrogenase